MPRLNSLGQAANAIGSTTINWEGQALPRHGGDSVWISPVEFVYQRDDVQPLTIEAYNTQTGAYRTVVRHGANHLVAGGNQWATFIVDRDGIDYEDSYGNINNSWYPMHISDGGVIAVCKYGTGVGLVTGKDTVIWVDETTPVLRLEAHVADGVVTWHDGTRLRAWSGVTKQELTLPPMLPIQGVRHSGGFMLGYCAWGLVVYKMGEITGWVVSTDGKDFGPDIRIIGQQIVVKSSAGEGEYLPWLPMLGLRSYVVDTNAPKVDLYEEPPCAVPQFAPHPCRVRVFDGPADENVDNLGVLFTVGRDDLDATAARCRQLKLPMLAYWDGYGYTHDMVPAVAGVEVIPTVMCYPRKNDPLEETDKQVEAMLANLTPKFPRVAVVIAGYRQIKSVQPPTYNWPLQQVLDTWAMVWDKVRKYNLRDVTVFLWTRGSGKDGLVSRPELMESYQRMKAAGAGELPKPKPPVQTPPVVLPPPVVVQPPPPPPPPIVIEEPSPVPPIVEPTPDPAPAPSGGKRKPNIAKALRTLANLLVDIFKPHGIPARYRPKPIEEPPADSPQPIEPPVVPPPPAPVLPSWPNREDVLKYRGHLCNLRDSKGGVIWTPALPGADEATFKDWTDILHQNGATHIPIGPFTPGEIYPGIGIINPDWTHNSGELRRFVQKLLNTPSASGKGFVPVVFLDSGDPDPKSRTRSFFQVAKAALGDLAEHCITLPTGWEPEAYSAKEISDALKEWKSLVPNAIVGYHGWPRRLVGSSNPIQPDDPWQGGESVFYTSNGGELIDIAFYQTEHGDSIYHDADPDDDAGGNWLNRLQDYLSRIGAGFHGWRKMPFVAFETVAYEFFRNKATSDQARDVASRIKKVADKWGIEIGYGNGFPWEM